MNTSTTITLDELKARLALGPIEEFWNVLTDQYYSGELLPGSRRVPLDRVGRVASDLARDTEIVVYCANFDCPQSHAAAEKLVALGFTNVRVYAGGIEEWLENGNQIMMDGLMAA